MPTFHITYTTYLPGAAGAKHPPAWGIGEVEDGEDYGPFSQRGPVENNVAYYSGSVSGETEQECYIRLNAILNPEGCRLARIFEPANGEWRFDAVPIDVSATQLVYALHRQGDAMLARSDYRVELL